MVSVSEDAELGVAVDLMLKHGVKRLPVLRGEAVVGDHRALRPAQGARRGAARRRTAAIPTPRSRRRSRPNSTASAGRRGRASGSTSANGVVTFGGAITDERLRSGLRVIAENTPGVTEVHDQMCWIEPNSGIYLPSEQEEGPTG